MTTQPCSFGAFVHLMAHELGGEELAERITHATTPSDLAPLESFRFNPGDALDLCRFYHVPQSSVDGVFSFIRWSLPSLSLEAAMITERHRDCSRNPGAFGCDPSDCFLCC